MQIYSYRKSKNAFLTKIYTKSLFTSTIIYLYTTGIQILTFTSYIIQGTQIKEEILNAENILKSINPLWSRFFFFRRFSGHNLR